jgi:Spy/CpxP family protein refolding chaperone
VTRRSLGTTQIVWGTALAVLLTVAGHSVWAVGHAQAAGQQTTPPATGSTTTPNQAQPPQRGGGRFDGPGGQFPGRPANANVSPVSLQWEWWKDADVKKEVGLKPDQVSRIDQYYSRRMKEIDPAVQEFTKEQVTLDKMLADRVVDDSTISLEMTKYYALRNSISQSHFLMLYRIAKVLDVEQYAKLKAIFDRRVKEMDAHRGGRGGTPEPSPLGFRH